MYVIKIKEGFKDLKPEIKEELRIKIKEYLSSRIINKRFPLFNNSEDLSEQNEHGGMFL